MFLLYEGGRIEQREVNWQATLKSPHTTEPELEHEAEWQVGLLSFPTMLSGMLRMLH